MTINDIFSRPRVLVPPAPLPSYPRDRRTIAHHEAAHAVLCCRFGIRFSGVYLYADGGGKVDWDGLHSGNPDPAFSDPAPDHSLDTGTDSHETSSEPLHLACVQIAVMYAAGMMAELLVQGLCPSAPLDLEIPDWQNARAVLREGFGHDRMLPDIQDLAVVFLVEHWEWISAVAAELDQHSEISEEDVRRLGVRWSARPFPEWAEKTGAPALT
jgi:hypothetical protein